MFKAMIVAFALAMAPATASAQATPGNQLPPGWGFIRMMGWTFQGSNVNSDDQALVFTMPARQPMHIWYRLEYKLKQTDFEYLSSRSLEQVDCNARRTRTVSAAYFIQNNVEELLLQVDEPSNWRYPAPDTLGVIPLEILCD